MTPELWTPPRKRVRRYAAPVGPIAAAITGAVEDAAGPGATVPPATNRYIWARADLNVRNAANATPANGEAVKDWQDQDRPLLFAQATAGNRPLYVSSWQGGRPAMTFDGSNDVLTIAHTGIGIGQALTVFVVGSSPVDTDSVDIGSNVKAWFSVQSATGNDANFITRYTGSAKNIAWTGAAATTISGSFGYGTSPAYLCWATDGSSGAANMTFRANGVAKTTSGALANTTAASFALYIGGGAGSGNLACTIAEVIVYTSFLSTPDIEAVEDYITSWYSL
jgi:hypothetical protein